MSETKTLIEARKVTRILPGPVPVTLVKDIDLAVGPGEFLAITGPSGSGKSSLLYLLGLLDRPTQGEVFLEGEATSRLSRAQLASRRLASLGFVFQFHFLLPELSAAQNVALPMRKLGKLSPAEIRQRTEDLMVRFDLADCLKKMPFQLSGGQRQRVALARALANDPLVVLADEPTGNLDTVNAGIVFDLFAEIGASEGRSVVCVTHDMELAARAERRVHLVDGMLTDDHAAMPVR
ncbi:MAG: ABC transporter ATP-binding protein [Rhodovibrionaceae bacterium]|nr:ABC transporter ATP-binding protein [Rhodovibrionaceae bacterium]